ncbi:MAG: helix-turn-helix domain-containing protein [Clostridia bacterium]|nr:helix-turn-helix domain-containing protein [Clostridia bacterium]
MVNTNELGILIRNARISKGLKQKDVAELIGCTPTIINRLEAGATRKTSLKIFLKLSIILELNFFELLKLGGYTQEKLDLETKKLYDKVSSFNDFPYLLFLLDKLSNNDLETINQLLAQTINMSNENKELVIKLYNAIPKLSSKEREILKLILS